MATCKDCVRYNGCTSDWHKLSKIEHICNNFKTNADYVEVVRCKDCEHYHRAKESTICDYDYCDILYYCDGSHRTACEQDYCSYGKRKDRTIT